MIKHLVHFVSSVLAIVSRRGGLINVKREDKGIEIIISI